MKKLVILLTALTAAGAYAQSHYVQPHVTRNGTYVQGHMQSNPDSSRMNNYSTQGNVNPYTGQVGTVNPYAPPQMPGYVSPQPSQAIRPNTSWPNPYRQ